MLSDKNVLFVKYMQFNYLWTGPNPPVYNTVSNSRENAAELIWTIYYKELIM